MLNSNSQAQVSKTHIPTYLPLAEAAEKFGLSKKVLTQMIQAGKIEAVQLSSGELLVPAERNGNGHEPKTKSEIISEKFAHLRGLPITVTAAAEKYGLSRNTVLEWVKHNYITALKEGYRMELDEAEVAYCASVYKEKSEQYGGQLRGVNIFDENGNPYRLMHPELAERRRRR